MKIAEIFKLLTYEEVKDFGRNQKNRQINEQHVNDFVNVLKNKQWVPDEDGDMVAYEIIPVIYNPVFNHILDAQHKHKAYLKCIEQGIIPDNVKILVGYWPIYNEELEHMITIDLNNKTKNWSLNDYMDCYSKYMDAYAKLKSFCENHILCKKINKDGEPQLKYRYGAAIVTGRGCEKVLKMGSLSFTEDQVALADIVHDEMVQIRHKLGIYKTSSEVEDMAKAWHTQRKIMNAKDIVSLKHIPSSVKERQIKSQKDWNEVFSILNNIVQQQKLKESEEAVE